MSTATTQRPSGLAHGTIAVGQHMQRHDLPNYGELDYEDDTHQLVVHLAEADGEAWKTSIAVDGFDTEDGSTGGFREWVTVTGRLPDTGVRIHLSWPRSKRTTEPAPLADTVAEVVNRLDPTQLATCEACGQEVDVTHGAERGQTLCSDCCHASNPCSHRGCCDEGAIR